ncbi:MAG: sulfatase-like hydrolase/transferase [Planctomycetota bacterium]
MIESRRFFLGCVLVWILPACLVGAADPPNVVLILSDDQAWNDYSFMGHPTIKTPNIDRLAAEASTFRRGYVPTALCRPSLASILTGHYPSTHGIIGNDPSKSLVDASHTYEDRRAELIGRIDRFKTLPEALGDAGYLTLQTGKHWEGSYKRVGFDQGMTRGFPERGGRHGDDGLVIGRQGLQVISDFMDDAKKKNQPFFVYYAPFLPHAPHTPPKRLLDKYSALGLSEPVARYQAMCEWFDETIGDLMKLVDDRGLREETLTVYVCDNGWIQSEKRNRFAPGSKQSANEAGVRTPIFYHWPGTISPVDHPALATSLDIPLTIAAAAGIKEFGKGETLPDVPGRNLLNALQSDEPVSNAMLEREFIWGEGFSHDVADFENHDVSLLYRWINDGTYKLLVNHDGTFAKYSEVHGERHTPFELYDLTKDPNETQDLSEQMPGVVKKLLTELDVVRPSRTPLVN